MRPSVTQKRKGDTGYGKESNVRARVDKKMNHKNERNPQTNEAIIIIPGKKTYSSYSKNNEEKCQEKKNASQNSPLLNKCRKKEVRLGLRQKLKMRLGSKTKSFSQKAGRPNCYFGLYNIVTRPQGVSVRKSEAS